MTHQEFLDRVKDNLKVDVNYYTKWIEPLYMMCDLDKDQFCASFNKWGKLMIDDPNETVFEYFARFYLSSHQYSMKVKDEKARMQKEIRRLEGHLIHEGHEEWVKIPTAEMIRRKLSMGLELTKEQKDYIKDNLK